MFREYAFIMVDIPIDRLVLTGTLVRSLIIFFFTPSTNIIMKKTYRNGRLNREYILRQDDPGN